MKTSVDPYFFLIVFGGVAVVFPLIPLALAWMWRRFYQPPKPGADKNSTFECGVAAVGEARVQFKSQYYIYCIIFLIFDVEAVFLVPFAVSFTTISVGAFVAVLVFLLLLVEGLVWAWCKGCLNWTR
jgi:NADH-quinone oxidoreductase subunit A